MKAIVVIFVVYAHIYYSALAYNFGDIQEKVNIVEILQKKCESNAGNTQAYNDFEEGLEILPKCVSKALDQELPNQLLEHDDFCRVLRTSGMYECVVNLTDSFRPCLDESEAYLPDFVLTMLNTTYNEMCGVNGLANIDRLYRIQDSVILGVNNTCFGIPVNILSPSMIYRNLTENSILDLNAKNLCSDLKLIQKHITLVLKQECNEDYSHFVDIHTQPFVDKCNVVLNE